jgi:hypothetical protein
MSRKRSSTAATGGKGFTFADKVAAAFFVQMLAREYPLEQSLGLVTELDFETKESGRSLDDLHLLFRSGSQVSRWSISVKSNRQLTRNGLNPEFVHDAWAEWRNEDGSGFDQTSDLLGIVIGVAGERPLHDWEEVRKEASDPTPERFLLRLVEGENQISSAKRKLFESLYPVKQPDRPQREETVRLAARLHVRHFNEKKDEGRCINQCAELVSAASIEEGTKL